MPVRRSLLLTLTVLAVVATATAVVADASASRGGPVVLPIWLDLVGFMWAAAGAVVVRARPRHTLGWVLLGVGAVTQLSIAEEALRRAGWAPETLFGHLLTVAGGSGIFMMLGLLPLLYPTGRLPSRRWRPLAAVVMIGAIAQMLQWLMSRLAGWRWPFDSGQASQAHLVDWLPFAVFALGTVAGWVLCGVRIARAGPPVRQQLVLLLVAVMAPMVLGPALGDSGVAQWVNALALMLLPAAIAIGIFRYRMLGIEVILRRGLVYAALTACVVTTYALVTWAGGAHLGGDTIPSMLAAALVAVGLLPLRSAAQRLVDRLLYGRRGDPLTAVSELGSMVAAAEPAALADQLVVGVREAVRAAGVRIDRPDGLLVAVAGTVDDDPAAVRVPLSAGGEDVGVLVVGPRTPGTPYTRDDERLLHALGVQVAVALHAVNSATELERQRDRVIAVRKEERDRLRRDLHDGLGPSLTGIGLGLRAVDDAASAADTIRVRELTDVIRAEVRRTVLDVRRILDDLRPAQVEERGLAAALEDAFGDHHAPPHVTVSATALPTLPDDVEDAAFRVALEATNNALRHAGARHVRVRVSAESGRLLVVVADDGSGLPADVTEGIGFASMRARAAAVGGTVEISRGAGTAVRLVVPLRQPVLT
jgi:signal transduction histidine kinase